ncbi:hypothetical protein LPB86_11175 [Pedobacter sp. MC2016-14]|uniref:hypothetical protein n=1 Tax=Pedobacter sp. MC2016-14 TaxID=2897327 RepID=UPI001E32B86D|nr:hypothetical protein [Pedobacter sp. MC2016-14]MCD0488796.1 hypothetical protein [Pedobacter sp. MC2016-14]
MARNLLIVSLLFLVFGCKKYSDDDTTFFKWKRDLYRARVQNDNPALFYSRDPKISGNPDAIFLSTDFVVLTEYRKDLQQDSIYKASGGMQVYKYNKVDN